MSSGFVFDTHKFVEQLTKAKMPKKQAEALADNYVSLLDGHLATKDDISNLKDLVAAKITKSQIVTISVIIGAVAVLLQIMG